MLHANAYVPAATDETYTRPTSEPLDTTPCSLPSASSTNGTLASLRGRAGRTTRAALDRSHSASEYDKAHLFWAGSSKGVLRRTGGTLLNIRAGTDSPR